MLNINGLLKSTYKIITFYSLSIQVTRRIGLNLTDMESSKLEQFTFEIALAAKCRRPPRRRNLLAPETPKRASQSQNTLSCHNHRGINFMSPKIHFINRVDPSNIGDWYCSPLQYYYNFFNKYIILRHDIEKIYWLEIAPRDIVIIGGGGLLYLSDNCQKTIQRLYATTPHVIAWGVGFNTHYGRKIVQPLDLDSFQLISIRDYAHPSGLKYVPCVSCLAPELRKRTTVKRKIGIIEHPSRSPVPDQPYEKIGNNVSFEFLTDFIASSEIIWATSYHAAYWSILMGKRVICTHWSTKFEHFKYKPVMYSGNLEDDIAKTVIYEESLEDAIEHNNTFFSIVKEFVLSHMEYGDNSYQHIVEISKIAALEWKHEYLEAQINNLKKEIYTLQKIIVALHKQ